MEYLYSLYIREEINFDLYSFELQKTLALQPVEEWDEISCSMAEFLSFSVCRVYAYMDYASYKNLQVFMGSQIE